MIDIGLVALTIFAYLMAAAWQLRFAPQNRGRLSKRSALLGVIAVLSHATVLGTQVSSQTSSALSLVDASSLAFLMTNIATLALLALRPLQTLLIVLFPLSALAVLIAAIGPDTVSPLALQPGTIIHIACSLAANALLAMAAMQAIIVSIQDRRLRAHNNLGLTQWLPPLTKNGTVVVRTFIDWILTFELFDCVWLLIFRRHARAARRPQNGVHDLGLADLCKPVVGTSLFGMAFTLSG